MVGGKQCRRETGSGCSPSSVPARSTARRSRRFWYDPPHDHRRSTTSKAAISAYTIVIAVTPNCWNGVRLLKRVPNSSCGSGHPVHSLQL